MNKYAVFIHAIKQKKFPLLAQQGGVPKRLSEGRGGKKHPI